MARLYLDEDVPPRLASLLQGQGHDVDVANQVGMVNIPDAVHLLRAARQSRTLVTFNRADFFYLHRLWTTLNLWGVTGQPHHGIITSNRQVPVDDWASCIESLLTSEGDFVNHLYLWDANRQEWLLVAEGKSQGAPIPSP